MKIVNGKGTEEMDKEPSVGDKSIYGINLIEMSVNLTFTKENNDLLAPVAIPKKSGNSVIQLHAVESKQQNLTSNLNLLLLLLIIL